MAERRPTTAERKKEKLKRTTAKKGPKKALWKKIVLAVLLIGLAGFIAGAGLFAYYASTAPELDEEQLKFPVSTEFYDVNGELFATMGSEKRTYIKYEDIPQEMIDAIIATEDARFFDHFGVDIWRLGGAVVANLRDGFGSQGGSTITQQVVKNSFLKNEKKLKRKAQEAWLAIKLERNYSKEEIFEMYFNRVLMSGSVYGFGTAAKTFYGKELDQLTLSEMAQLAGMPQSPNNYNPFTNPDKAQKRRDIVLSLMVQHKKITKAQADEAKKENITDLVLPVEERGTNTEMKYPAFVKAVLEELAENDESEHLADGLKIYTTLDPNAQQIVENIMNNPEYFPTETIQSGVAVVDTKTGAVRAIGGGRNYSTELNWNYATQINGRSIGSTAKPLVSYGPAIEYLQWSTGQTTVDEKMTYPNTNQVINNWDGQYKGKMTIRQALYTSRNVPAVKTYLEVGADKSKAFLSKLGINVKTLVPSSPLGPKIDINTIQMAGAYAAFGNNGVYNKPHTITKIVYRDGKTETVNKQKTKVAMSDYTAYMITDILRDTVSNLPDASGSYAIVSGIDVAGKTGTSNYSAEDFAKYNLPETAVPDSWFVGYTTDYSIAIWSGYENQKNPITTWPERRLPQTLFKSIMTQLVINKKPESFKKPNSVVEATIEVGSNPLKLASEYTPDNLRRTELFVRGTEPKGVSDKYKAPAIGSISNLKATLSEDSQSVQLSWNYSAPNNEGSSTAPTFEIAISEGGGDAKVVGTTKDKAFTVSSIKPSTNYTFIITPIIDNHRGSSAKTSIFVQIEEKPDDENKDNPGDQDKENENNNPNNGQNPGNQGGDSGGTDDGSQGSDQGEGNQEGNSGNNPGDQGGQGNNNGQTQGGNNGQTQGGNNGQTQGGNNGQTQGGNNGQTQGGNNGQTQGGNNQPPSNDSSQ